MKEIFVYQEQSEHFGKTVLPLLEWFAKNARVLPWRDIPTPYRVWISEIMLQQTRVEAVKPYFARFMKELPDVAALAQVPDEKLMKLWEGLGYYSRARNLKRAAQVIMEQHNGEVPSSYEKLLELPGIGSYTAGAVASIAFGESVPAVDGNVLRVFTRITACGDTVSDMAVKRRVEQAVHAVIPRGKAGVFNQALMELGATVCLPGGEPHCSACPVQTLCKAHALGIERSFPVKAKKAPRRAEERTVLLLVSAGEAALIKRPANGLLAGLWEFPNIEGFLTEDGVQEVVSAWGANVQNIRPLPPAKHIFSHVEWHMQGWWVDVDSLPKQFMPAGRIDLQEQYALPSAFRVYLKSFVQ